MVNSERLRAAREAAGVEPDADLLARMVAVLVSVGILEPGSDPRPGKPD